MDHRLIQGLVAVVAVFGLIAAVQCGEGQLWFSTRGQEVTRVAGRYDNVEVGVNSVLMFHKGRPGWVDSSTSSPYDTIAFQAPNGVVLWEGTTAEYRRLVESHSLTATADEVNEQLKTVFGQSVGE